MASDQWTAETLRIRKRAEAAERFIVFAEQVSRARSRREVLEALLEHASEVVGGYRPVIWFHSSNGGGPADSHDLPALRDCWASPWVPSLASPILVTRADAESAEVYADLARLYETSDSTAGSIVSLDEGMALVVLERRSDRRWEPAHWFQLRAMAGLARACMQRLEAPVGVRMRT